jgi:hypothetical protein
MTASLPSLGLHYPCDDCAPVRELGVVGPLTGDVAARRSVDIRSRTVPTKKSARNQRCPTFLSKSQLSLMAMKTEATVNSAPPLIRIAAWTPARAASLEALKSSCTRCPLNSASSARCLLNSVVSDIVALRKGELLGRYNYYVSPIILWQPAAGFARLRYWLFWLQYPFGKQRPSSIGLWCRSMSKANTSLMRL